MANYQGYVRLNKKRKKIKTPGIFSALNVSGNIFKLDAKDTQKYLKKSLPQLRALAQKHFNKFIVRRDLAAGHGCISCKSLKPNQAGHYYSRGSHPALAMDEDNVFLQDVSCNLWKHGNLIEMRKGMIKRIGEERVKALDDRAAIFKRGWKVDKFFYIEKIITYKSKNIVSLPQFLLL